MSRGYQWVGPMPNPPAAELLERLDAEGLELVQIIQALVPQPEQNGARVDWLVLVRRREPSRVVLPH